MSNLFVETWPDYAMCRDGVKRCFKTSNIWEYDGDKTIRKIGVYLHDPDHTYSNECCYDDKNGGFKYYKTNAKMIHDVLYKVNTKRQYPLVKLEDADFFREGDMETLAIILRDAE